MSAQINPDEWREMLIAFAQPFDTMDFLPKAARGDTALALAFIDARDVQRRLNAVCGSEWSFDFDVLTPDCKKVKGKLTVRGVTRCDAGEASQEDEPLKSAVSDALKRAAVHFGIGQYLYYLPQVWADYDSQKRKWKGTPRIDPRDISKAVAIVVQQRLAERPPASEPVRPRQEPAPESHGDRQAVATAPEPRQPVAASGERGNGFRPPAASGPQGQAFLGNARTSAQGAGAGAPSGAPAETSLARFNRMWEDAKREKEGRVPFALRVLGRKPASEADWKLVADDLADWKDALKAAIQAFKETGVLPHPVEAGGVMRVEMSRVLGVPVESRKECTAAELRRFAQACKQSTLPPEVHEPEIVDDNPFTDEPEHPRSALAQGL
jgi:hypothetical protein